MSFNMNSHNATNDDIMQRVAGATGAVIRATSAVVQDIGITLERDITPAIAVATAVARDIRPAALAAADAACSNQQSLAVLLDSAKDIAKDIKKIYNRLDLIDDDVLDISRNMLTTNNLLFALLSDEQKAEYEQQRLAEQAKEDRIEAARQWKRELKGPDYTDRKRARLANSPAAPAYSPTSPAYSPTSPAYTSSSVETLD